MIPAFTEKRLIGRLGRAVLTADKATAHQVVENKPGVLLGRVMNSVELDFRVERRLVGGVNAGEAGDFPTPRLGVEARHIAGLTDLKRRIDKNLYKVVGAHHAANLITGAAIGAGSRAQGYPAVAHDLGGDEAHAAHVGVPV